MKVKSISRVQLLATPWTAAYQAPLSMGFARQGFALEWVAIAFKKVEMIQPQTSCRQHIRGKLKCESSQLSKEGGPNHQRVFITFLSEIMSVATHIWYIWFIIRCIRKEMGRESYRYKERNWKI